MKQNDCNFHIIFLVLAEYKLRILPIVLFLSIILIGSIKINKTHLIKNKCSNFFSSSDFLFTKNIWVNYMYILDK